MIIARTSEGDVGILPGHAPLLSVMVDGVIDVTTVDGETWIAAVDAGFLSVAEDRVSVLSEHAEMAHDINLEKAKADLERAHQAGAIAQANLGEGIGRPGVPQPTGDIFQRRGLGQLDGVQSAIEQSSSGDHRQGR